jgi:hypothetical protein
MISPAIFIPIAEKNGTIIPIGNWVMGEAIRQFAGWKKKYGYEMILSLNISALQYKRPDFIDLLMKHVEENDVSPEEIELEITETVLIDDFKAVIDRTLPLTKMSMQVVDGQVVHNTVVDLSKKKYVVITGCGFPNWDGNFDGLKIQCKNSFGNNLTMVCVSETPMLNQPTAEPLTKPLLEKFTKAGEEYINNLSLSDETIAALETPMIPNEIYIQIVNSQ